ncbi:MAG: type IV secretion system DNA-binding domain-containing protein [Thermoplasmata archaeon]|nr:type IV secretion system DNA-binding domain-containing protein [Thermoplasmata archaeon]
MRRAEARRKNAGAMLRTSSPGWSGAYLRELARSIAASPRGVRLLVRQLPKAAGPILRSDREGMDSLLGAAAARIPGRVEFLEAVDPLKVERRGEDLCLAVVPDPVPTAETPLPERSAGFARHRSREEVVPAARTAPIAPVPALESPPGLSGESHAVWESEGNGRLAVRLRSRWSGPSPELARELAGVTAGILRRTDEAGFPRAKVLVSRSRRVVERAWSDPWSRWRFPGPSFSVLPEVAAREVSLPSPRAFPSPSDLLHHAVAVGASGSGKTSWLVGVARQAIERGTATVILDVHGDVGPRLVAGLSREARARVVVLDPTDDRSSRSGIRVLGGSGVAPEVEAAHLVAALKRLTGDGGETFWGFRMERIFDTFVRRVQEEGGTLVDLFDLLTDPSRRDAARLATAIPAVARFLEELPAIQQRNPEYLAPAAARIAKVLLRDELTRLLAPADAGLPIDLLLEQGRSVLIRVPIGALGPEASSFASTLLVSRLYLGRTASPIEAVPRLRSLFVIDEASSVSPKILSEILSEGRKFGVGLLLATQYPERLSMELRAAAAGAAGSHLAFRIPRASASQSGSWVGLSPGEAVELLPNLPAGSAVLSARDDGSARRVLEVGPSPAPDPEGWADALRATATEFPGSAESTGGSEAGFDSEMLFAILGLEARRELADAANVGRWLHDAPTGGVDPAAVPARLPILERRGWIDGGTTGGWRVTGAGRRYLACDGRTGASRETSEHRALLLGAFQRMAAKGYRVEILRQGRFDTRLPDARLCQLPRGSGLAVTPVAWAGRVDRARVGWAWRFFRGRDVFFEAEVSGATRRERIRHDVTKAERAEAFLVVLVSDAARARSVRRALRELTEVPHSAQVWMIPEAAALRPGGSLPPEAR